jgi:hypothetical protein
MIELTISERQRLKELETIIENGLQTFVEVGEALAIIRDGELYKEDYDTFESYCRERWGMGRTFAFYQIKASGVVGNLNVHNCERLPQTESQARPLTQLEPEQQQQAWYEAINQSNGRQPTAKVVERIVKEIKQAVPKVIHNAGDNEWYTPEEYIKSALIVMKWIDLDPASSDIANKMIAAKEYYTIEDSGLNYQWSGKVWLNPPYARDLVGNFMEKLLSHFCDGDITEAITLTNNSTETKWFQAVSRFSSAICLPEGRVKFWHPRKEAIPLQGQAILYLGNNAKVFSQEFEKYGVVWIR